MLFILAAIIPTVVIGAPLHYKTDYSATGNPPTSQGIPPGQYGWYEDPVFGTKIMQVTGSGSCLTTYSYWPSFNADSTKILVECAGATNHLYALNKSLLDTEHTYAGLGFTDYGTIQDTVSTLTLEPEGAFWSQTNPNIIYVLGGDTVNSNGNTLTRLYRIDISQSGANRFGNKQDSCSTANSLGCLVDFYSTYSNSQCPATIPANTTLAELGKSENDDVFTFRTDPADNSSTKVFTYVLSSNCLTAWATPSGDGNNIHESQVNKSATGGSNPGPSGYTYIEYYNNPDNYIWNIGAPNTTYTNFTTDTGHYDLGRSFIVAAHETPDPNNQYEGLDLFRPGSVTQQKSILTFLESNTSSLNLCNDGCFSNSDCPSGTTCATNGVCVGGQTCTGNPDCPLNSTCNLPTSGFCTVGRPCHALHTSLRSHDEKVAELSTMTGLTCIPGTNCTPSNQLYSYYSYPFNNEIILAYTSNTSTLSQQSFVRIAHTRSDYTYDKNANYYEHMPKANLDKLFRYVAFTSDMGSTSSYNVFIAKLPTPVGPAMGDVTTNSTSGVSFHLDYAGRLWSNAGGSWAMASSPGAGVVLTGGLARASNSTMDSVIAIGNDGKIHIYYNTTPGTSPGTWTWESLTPANSGCPQGATGDPIAFSTTGGHAAIGFRCANDPNTGAAGIGYFYWSTGSTWLGDVRQPPSDSAAGNAAIGLGATTTWYVATLGRTSQNLYVFNRNTASWSTYAAPTLPSGVYLVGSPVLVGQTDPPNVFVTDSAGNIWQHSSSWTEIGQGTCPVDGDLAGGAVGSDWYVAGRCASGDQITAAHRNSSGVWSWANTWFSQSGSGYFGNMPLSVPRFGYRSTTPKLYFQTTAGEQIEATFNGTSWSNTDRSGVNYP